VLFISLLERIEVTLFRPGGTGMTPDIEARTPRLMTDPAPIPAARRPADRRGQERLEDLSGRVEALNAAYRSTFRKVS
jgi:hypothetical protein